MVVEVDVHIPSTQPGIEPIENAVEPVIEREPDLVGIVAVDVVDKRHDQP